MGKDRYSVPADEGYEPGSNNLVLKNLLGVNDPLIMESLEEEELVRTGLDLIKLYDQDHKFTAEDICNIHELWLSGIYSFSGKYRTVMMSKDGFPFASPQLISSLMLDLETKYLAKYTPCKFSKDEELAEALSIVHLELIIIHPFRDGNGRVARLLANLMSMQAGRDFIDYSPIDRTINADGYKKYIESIHEGFNGNYDLIKKVFLELINIS